MHVRTMITSVFPEHACPHDDNVRVTRACMSARKMIDSAVFLATQRLRRNPGYWTVLKALALDRKDRVHELGHGPQDFLSPAKDKDWLKL